MACVRGDPAAGTNTTVADASCLSAKPATWQACNTDLACIEVERALVDPAPGAVYSAGSVVNITWNGGTPYGTASVEVQQVRMA